MHRLFVQLYFYISHLMAIPRDWLFCSFHGLKYRCDWLYYGLPIVQRRRGAIITIGARFKACSDPKRNSIGVFQKVMLKANQPGAQIRIGNDVGLSGCVIAASSFVSVGNNVLIGSGALITDSDAHPLDSMERLAGGDGVTRRIIIEDDVFIGARAVILKGVILGRGCVVGAGAVVSKDIPPYCVVAGNPARVVGAVR